MSPSGSCFVLSVSSYTASWVIYGILRDKKGLWCLLYRNLFARDQLFDSVFKGFHLL